MPYTIETAIRQIARPAHAMQHYERLHLTRERFRLENGIWVRRHHLEPQEYPTVFNVSGKLDDADRLLMLIEAGIEPPPGE